MNDLLQTAYAYVDTVRYKSEMANGSRVWHDWALKEAFMDGYRLAEEQHGDEKISQKPVDRLAQGC